MKLTNWALISAVAVAIGAVSHRTQLADIAAPPRRRDVVAIRIFSRVSEHRLFAVSAGVAFYALLALAPALAVAVSLFGLVADPAQLTQLSSALTQVLPTDAAHLVQGEAQRLAAQGAQALSAKLALALFLSLWSASAAVRATFDALNVIHGQLEQRSTVRLYAIALVATLASVVMFLLSLAAIGANPKFMELGVFSSETVYLYSLARWPAFFCVAVLVITCVYWIGPSRTPARFVRLLPGAAAAALLWAVGSFLFSWYVSTLAHYTATYGSLATVVVVMTWLWLSAAIVLFGAELNSEWAGSQNAGPARKNSGNL